MLLTAQRVGEVSSMEWAEIDLKRGWWTIPAAKAKNRLAHRVPLTGMALELILARPRQAGARYVFPVFSSTTPDPLQGGAVRARRCGLKDWTPRDLRRTAASPMTGLGVPRLVVSRILNHAERGVTAVYDRHSYDEEKRQALELWEERLREIIGGRSRRRCDRFSSFARLGPLVPVRKARADAGHPHPARQAVRASHKPSPRYSSGFLRPWTKLLTARPTKPIAMVNIKPMNHLFWS
jgi:hypothetical protein